MNIKSLYSFGYCTVIRMLIDTSDDPINLSNIYQNAYSISAFYGYRKVNHYCRPNKASCANTIAQTPIKLW